MFRGIVKQKLILKLYLGGSGIYRIAKPNIMRFKPKSDLLSDSDIVSMFNAFVNLIMNNTLLKYERMYHNKTKYLESRLNDCLILIAKKDKQINSLCKIIGVSNKNINDKALDKMIAKLRAN